MLCSSYYKFGSKNCALALAMNCSDSAVAGEASVCADDRRSSPRVFKHRCQMYAYNCIYSGDYEITNLTLCNKKIETALVTVSKTVTKQSLDTQPTKNLDIQGSTFCALALAKNCSSSAVAGDGSVCADEQHSPPREFKNRCQMHAYNCIYNRDYEITYFLSCIKNKLTTTLEEKIKPPTEQSLKISPIATESVFLDSLFHRSEEHLDLKNFESLLKTKESNLQEANGSIFHSTLLERHLDHFKNYVNARRAMKGNISEKVLRLWKTKRPNRHPGYKTPRYTATSKPGRIGRTILATPKDKRPRYFYRYYAPEGRAKATNTYRHSRTTHRRTRIISKWTGWQVYHTAPTWWKLSKWRRTRYPWWLVTSSQTVRLWEYVDKK